jgi:hypothetical protein
MADAWKKRDDPWIPGFSCVLAWLMWLAAAMHRLTAVPGSTRRVVFLQ